MAESSKINRKFRKYCCAINCKNRKGDTPGVKFFKARRPKDKDKSLAWARAINRQNEQGELWMPGKSDRICSEHFIDGKHSNDRLAPNYRPTIFSTHEVKLPKSARKRHERKLQKAAAKKARAKTLPKPRTYHPVTLQILNDDKKCRQMCGVPKGLFELTYEVLNQKEDGFLDLEKISVFDRDQLAIYFTKFKTGSTFAQIGIMFGGIDARIVSRIFVHILKKHYEATKHMIWWYSRKEVDETMPKKFKEMYPKTRVVLDATEIKIQVIEFGLKLLIADFPKLISFFAKYGRMYKLLRF